MADNKGKDKKDDNKKKDDNNKKDKKTFEDYGFVKAFLDDHPAVRRLVKKAVKEQWSKERFQGAVKDTYWAREHSDSQKRADILQAENPQEWNRQVQAMQAQLGAQAQQMGLTFTPAQMAAYASTAVRNGYTSQEMTSWLANHGQFSLENASGGASVTIDALRETAAAYGLRMSDSTLAAQVKKALGSGDMGTFLQGYEDTIREQAKTLYPSIADKLDRGMTVRDVASPFLEIAGSELGLDPNGFNLTDPKWTAMFSGSGGIEMNQDQWLAKLRTDERYGWAKTNSAKNQASDFAQQLLGLMRGGVGV